MRAGAPLCTACELERAQSLRRQQRRRSAARLRGCAPARARDRARRRAARPEGPGGPWPRRRPRRARWRRAAPAALPRSHGGPRAAGLPICVPAAPRRAPHHPARRHLHALPGDVRMRRRRSRRSTRAYRSQATGQPTCGLAHAARGLDGEVLEQIHGRPRAAGAAGGLGSNPLAGRNSAPHSSSPALCTSVAALLPPGFERGCAARAREPEATGARRLSSARASSERHPQHRWHSPGAALEALCRGHSARSHDRSPGLASDGARVLVVRRGRGRSRAPSLGMRHPQAKSAKAAPHRATVPERPRWRSRAPCRAHGVAPEVRAGENGAAAAEAPARDASSEATEQIVTTFEFPRALAGTSTSTVEVAGARWPNPR